MKDLNEELLASAGKAIIPAEGKEDFGVWC